MPEMIGPGSAKDGADTAAGPTQPQTKVVVFAPPFAIVFVVAVDAFVVGAPTADVVSDECRLPGMADEGIHRRTQMAAAEPLYFGGRGPVEVLAGSDHGVGDATGGFGIEAAAISRRHQTGSAKGQNVERGGPVARCSRRRAVTDSGRGRAARRHFASWRLGSRHGDARSKRSGNWPNGRTQQPRRPSHRATRHRSRPLRTPREVLSAWRATTAIGGHARDVRKCRSPP